MAYQCDACGKGFDAIDSAWVRQFDPKHQRVLWQCPNCGRLQKDGIHFMHDEDLDYRPGRKG